MGERDATIRERDEARDSVAMLNACVTGLTARAEKAEALLRDALVFVECYRDVMAQREAEYPALLAKIREALS